MLNHFPPATFAAKPVGVVGYSMGRLGGANVTVQLRDYLNELAMICLPIMVRQPLTASLSYWKEYIHTYRCIQKQLFRISPFKLVTIEHQTAKKVM